jgi:hemolysin activation/secretion protein
VITGDRVPVYSLNDYDKWENEALYAPLTIPDVEAYRLKLLKALQDDGYLFATVSVYKNSLKLGFLKLRVSVGDKGEVTVTGNRWHTSEQVTKNVEWEKGGQFNYKKLHEDLFDLNVKPGMRVDTELKPRTDAEGKRIVDVNLAVKDRFPIRAAWTISYKCPQNSEVLNPTLIRREPSSFIQMLHAEGRARE